MPSISTDKAARLVSPTGDNISLYPRGIHSFTWPTRCTVSNNGCINVQDVYIEDVCSQTCAKRDKHLLCTDTPVQILIQGPLIRALCEWWLFYSITSQAQTFNNFASRYISVKVVEFDLSEPTMFSNSPNGRGWQRDSITVSPEYSFHAPTQGLLISIVRKSLQNCQSSKHAGSPMRIAVNIQPDTKFQAPLHTLKCFALEQLEAYVRGVPLLEISGYNAQDYSLNNVTLLPTVRESLKSQNFLSQFGDEVASESIHLPIPNPAFDATIFSSMCDKWTKVFNDSLAIPLPADNTPKYNRENSIETAPSHFKAGSNTSDKSFNALNPDPSSYELDSSSSSLGVFAGILSQLTSDMNMKNYSLDSPVISRQVSLNESSLKPNTSDHVNSADTTVKLVKPQFEFVGGTSSHPLSLIQSLVQSSLNVSEPHILSLSSLFTMLNDWYSSEKRVVPGFMHLGQSLCSHSIMISSKNPSGRSGSSTSGSMPSSPLVAGIAVQSSGAGGTISAISLESPLVTTSLGTSSMSSPLSLSGSGPNDSAPVTSPTSSTSVHPPVPRRSRLPSTSSPSVLNTGQAHSNLVVPPRFPPYRHYQPVIMRKFLERFLSTFPIKGSSPISLSNMQCNSNLPYCFAQEELVLTTLMHVVEEGSIITPLSDADKYSLPGLLSSVDSSLSILQKIDSSLISRSALFRPTRISTPENESSIISFLLLFPTFASTILINRLITFSIIQCGYSNGGSIRNHVFESLLKLEMYLKSILPTSNQLHPIPTFFSSSAIPRLREFLDLCFSEQGKAPSPGESRERNKGNTRPNLRTPADSTSPLGANSHLSNSHTITGSLPSPSDVDNMSVLDFQFFELVESIIVFLEDIFPTLSLADIFRIAVETCKREELLAGYETVIMEIHDSLGNSARIKSEEEKGALKSYTADSNIVNTQNIHQPVYPPYGGNAQWSHPHSESSSLPYGMVNTSNHMNSTQMESKAFLDFESYGPSSFGGSFPTNSSYGMVPMTMPMPMNMMPMNLNMSMNRMGVNGNSGMNMSLPPHLQYGNMYPKGILSSMEPSYVLTNPYSFENTNLNQNHYSVSKNAKSRATKRPSYSGRPSPQRPPPVSSYAPATGQGRGARSRKYSCSSGSGSGSVSPLDDCHSAAPQQLYEYEDYLHYYGHSVPSSAAQPNNASVPCNPQVSYGSNVSSVRSRRVSPQRRESEDPISHSSSSSLQTASPLSHSPDQRPLLYHHHNQITGGNIDSAPRNGTSQYSSSSTLTQNSTTGSSSSSSSNSNTTSGREKGERQYNFRGLTPIADLSVLSAPQDPPVLEFKCPVLLGTSDEQCPAAFSLKSNRSRHLAAVHKVKLSELRTAVASGIIRLCCDVNELVDQTQTASHSLKSVIDNVNTMPPSEVASAVLS